MKRTRRRKHTPGERFWSKVRVDGDCWVWAGALQERTPIVRKKPVHQPEYQPSHVHYMQSRKHASLASA
jgi:hypothetical protein